MLIKSAVVVHQLENIPIHHPEIYKKEIRLIIIFMKKNQSILMKQSWLAKKDYLL